MNYTCLLCDVKINDWVKHCGTKGHVKNHEKGQWNYCDVIVANSLIYRSPNLFPLLKMCKKARSYKWMVKQ